MKVILKQFLKYYLKYITKLVLLIHRPLIIGVTGSINVPFVKDEIKKRLAEMNFAARSNPKNFNTEIGLPLAILNLPSGYNSYKNWLPIIWQAFMSIFKLKFAKILVLGLGVSRPGDMKYLTSLVKPEIGVITDITQRYIESFEDMDELVGEYEIFVQAVKKNGYLILNRDNRRIQKLINNNSGRKTIFFGLDNCHNDSVDYWRGEPVKKNIDGQTVRVSRGKETVSYEIKRFGQHHVYARLAGLIIKKVILNFQPYAIPEKRL